MRALFIILCICFTGTVLAQKNLVKQWDRDYGGFNDEALSVLYETRDKGFMLVGTSFSDSSGDITARRKGQADSWVVKTDSLGIIQWQKRYGGSPYVDLLASQQTADGGYIFGGITNSDKYADVSQYKKGFIDCWVIKTDSLGNKQWDKRYGGKNDNELYALRQTSDGNYILGCITYSDSTIDVSQNGRGFFDYWLVKIDTAGNKLWDKRFGGPHAEMLADVLQTPDGGYLLGGYTDSDSGYDISQSTRGRQDYWIVKTDSLGNKEWDRRFGYLYEDILRSLVPATGGGYILAGTTYSDRGGDITQPTRGLSDYWIVKIDDKGTKQWDRRYGGISDEWQFGGIRNTADGGYVLGGQSGSRASGDISEPGKKILGQTWIIKIDSLGRKQWDKTVFTDSVERNDVTGFVIQSSDGCYVVANYTPVDTGGYKTAPNKNPGYSDYWMIKFCDTATSLSGQCNLSQPSLTASQTTFCPADSVQLCAPAGFDFYHWNNSTATGSCLYTRQPGSYYVTVTDPSGCTAESNHLSLSVYPSPPVSVTVKNDTFYASTGLSYQWWRNGAPIPGATRAMYIATQPGSYQVQIKDANGCTVLSSPVQKVTGIPGLDESTVLLYPNPSHNGHCRLTVDGSWLGALLQLYDTGGRILSESLIQELNTDIIAGPAAGIYFLRLSSPQHTLVKKIVKL